MTSERSLLPSFQTTSADAATPLRALAQRRDIPRALREASEAFLSHGAAPATSLLAAAGSRDLPSVLTALLALDAEAMLGGGEARNDEWRSISALVGRDGGLVLGKGDRVTRVRMAALVDRGTGVHSSAYREVVVDDVLVGAAVGVTLSPVEGPIVSAQVALCGAASYPIRARQVEATMRGRRPSRELVELASETAAQESQPSGVGSAVKPAVLLAVREVTRLALEDVLGGTV